MLLLACICTETLPQSCCSAACALAVPAAAPFCVRLCELNVLRQLFHVATSPVVAGAWADGQELHLYGVIYDLADGHLRKLAGPISGDDSE